MNILPNQLSKQLQNGLTPIYLIYGDEPLQITKSIDKIRACAKKEGYNENIVLDTKEGFDWTELLQHSNSLSLFSDKRLIEVRLSTLTNEASKALVAYSKSSYSDNILLLVANKLDNKIFSKPWFNNIKPLTSLVNCKQIYKQQLPTWIINTLKDDNFNISYEAAEYISGHTEGNLLATNQVLDKIKLNFNISSQIKLKDVIELTNNDCIYTVFNLLDSALLGDSSRTINILNCLRSIYIEPIIVLWALTKEVRTLRSIKNSLINSNNLAMVLKNHGIWQSKVNIIKSALNRVSLANLENILKILPLIDKKIKGVITGCPWQDIEKVLLLIATNNLFSKELLTTSEVKI